MTGHDRAALVFTAAALLAVTLLVVYDSPTPSISPAVARTSDSLRSTHQAHMDTVNALAQRETVYVAKADTRATAATIATARADERRRVADSLAALAIISDNKKSELWRAAYDTLASVADSLRDAARMWEQAYSFERDARLAATARADLETDRRMALEEFSAALEEDLRRATECRIVWRVPCPTRKQAAVGGAVAGAVGVAALVAALR